MFLFNFYLQKQFLITGTIYSFYSGDGCLSQDELEDVITLCLDESRLSLHEDFSSELTKLVWCKMSDGHSDFITFTEFYNALKEYPSVYNNLHIEWVLLTFTYLHSAWIYMYIIFIRLHRFNSCKISDGLICLNNRGGRGIL